MRQSFVFILFVIWATLMNAQTYNPFVDQGDINPKPLLPAEFNGSGTITFRVGNSGTSPLVLIPDQEMTLVLTLSRGVPNNVNPLNAISGAWASYFDWTYNSTINTYTAIQNSDIPANQSGTITLAYRVTSNSTQPVSSNGFNLNLQPPPYANGSNNSSDDATNGYTYVRATDFGDAPLSYGSASAEINLFRNSSGNYVNFVMLGDTIDHDVAYLPSSMADGDNNDNLNDENGVTFPTMIQGTTVTLPVLTRVRGGTAHFLNAWIDWNGDGDFADSGEKIANNVSVFTTQTTNVTVNIPATATAGTTFARFRFGSIANATGTSTYGEVEDYQLNIIASNPSIEIVKTGTYQDLAPLGVYNAGDQITYTFAVTNTGNVPLTNVIVTDPLVTLTGTAIPVLNPGATNTTNYTATYTLTQANINAGTFTNIATATGTFNSLPVTDTDDDVQTFIQTPSINIVKSATPQTYNAVNQLITYSFTVTNTGNVTLSNVSVSDPLPGLSSITPAPVTLAPNQSQVFTATYTISQTNLNNGSVMNTATATGTPPTGPNVTDTDDETITAVQTPSINIVKSATPQTYNAVNQLITYSFTVTNTGNVTLSNVSVSDPLPGLSSITPAPVTLAPNQSQVFTATYTISQTNLNNGSVMNTATATGTPPTGPNVTDTDDETITAVQTPSINIVKSATPQTYNAVNQLITYSFTVTNTGNVTLSNVSVSDPLPGLSSITPAPVTLAPNQSQVFTATYTISQTNLNNGSVLNTATATGTPPTGPNVTDTDDETITAVQTPSINIVKSATPQTYNAVNQLITYSFTVTNTGNVTLSNVSVSDPLPGLSSITPAPVTLAPNQSQVFTATYTISQTNLNDGSVMNTATATGTPPTGPNVTDTDDETITAVQTPSINIVKSATPQTYNAVNQLITYSFTVTNTGNVTLSNVSVSDPLPGLSSITPAPVTLAPNQSQVFTATYTISQTNLNDGSVMNTATATGTPPTGPNVTDTDDETITAVQTPSINIVKSATPQTYNAVNQLITYSFTVTNTGNVTLSNVSVSDPLPGLSSITPTPVTLAPNQSQVFTATYTISQTNLNDGSVMNTATATGTPPTGPNVTDTDDETITANQNALIELLKSGTWNDTNNDGFAQEGETITYEFEVTNVGNVTVNNLVINDPRLSLVNLQVTPSTLNPGQSGTATASYVVTQSDINDGGVYNIATATGQDPQGNDVEDESEDPNPLDPNDPHYDPNCPDCTYTGLPQRPGIQIVKSSTTVPNRYSYVGDVLTYNLTVTNTGNVTLTNVVVSDPVAVVSGSPIASLLPNHSVVLTASYTVVLSDLQNGQFVNVATATGNYTDDFGDPQTISDDDDETIPAVIPDVTPVITAIPNVMTGKTAFNLTVRVTELNMINTNGLITVRIPKDARLSFKDPYNPALTILGSIPLNNADWSFTQDATNYIFSSTTVIPAGSFSTFGFVAEFDPGFTKGVYTLTSQIVSGSGGEIRINNNVDSERIDYFIE